MLSCIWEEVIRGLISRYYAGSWLLEFYKFDFTAQLISINTHTLLDSFAHSSIAKDRIHSNWSKPRGLHYRLTEGWRSRLSAKLLRTPLSSWTYSACATKRKRAVTATADCKTTLCLAHPMPAEQMPTSAAFPSMSSLTQWMSELCSTLNSASRDSGDCSSNPLASTPQEGMWERICGMCWVLCLRMPPQI